WLMMSLWDALRMNMMISYQELVRTFLRVSHATAQNWCIAYQTNNSINIRPVVDIMENLFFLVVAAILLAVSVYFLISYLKDRKKTKLTFNKRK
ncbi:hypothetical protein CYD61_28475, partial [Klebsiella pneumoniae]